MKTRGILFKSDLHQAILAGKKTETRRLDPAWAKLKKGDRLYVKEKLLCHPGTAAAEYALDWMPVEPAPYKWHWNRSWLSPLHMPQDAARTWLELVEDGRSERLLDIDGDAARREGVVPDGILWRFGDVVRVSARDTFLARWDQTHPVSEPNPYVAVLRFRLVSP